MHQCSKYYIQEGVHVYIERSSYIILKNEKTNSVLKYHPTLGSELIELSVNAPKLLKYYLKVMLFNVLIQSNNLEYYREVDAEAWVTAVLKENSDNLFNISEDNQPIDICLKHIHHFESDFGCTTLLYNDYSGERQTINKQVYRLLCRKDFYKSLELVEISETDKELMDGIISVCDSVDLVNRGQHIVVRTLLAIHTNFISKTPVENYLEYFKEYYKVMWR